MSPRSKDRPSLPFRRSTAREIYLLPYSLERPLLSAIADSKYLSDQLPPWISKRVRVDGEKRPRKQGRSTAYHRAERAVRRTAFRRSLALPSCTLPRSTRCTWTASSRSPSPSPSGGDARDLIAHPMPRPCSRIRRR